MAFIPIPKAIEVVLYFEWNGQVVALTLGLKKATAVTPTDLVTATDLAHDLASNLILPLATNTLSLNSIKATDLTTDSSPTYTALISPPEAGNDSNDGVPNNVAVVTSQLTASRGRSYRGRNYLPGLSSSYEENGVQATAATAAALSAGYADFADDCDAAGLPFCVLSRYHDNAPRVEGVATPITGHRTDTFFDSQRRRLAGRGT